MSIVPKEHRPNLRPQSIWLLVKVYPGALSSLQGMKRIVGNLFQGTKLLDLPHSHVAIAMI